MRQRQIEDQVIVITGASSGIGLATAYMAADRGARVVLGARSSAEVEKIAEKLNSRGKHAAGVEVDVRNPEQVERLGAQAIQRFGRIDTWINNAGVSIYGEILDVPLEEQRALFDTNYWGVVHGSLVAVRHLRERGGTIINIGSTLSDRAIPLQGVYSASKHAVKGFTDSLRMELEEKGVPIHVTLIKPGAIGTPYAQHAANYMESEPQLPPPAYAPEVAAEGILFCAEHPRRDMFIGSGGKIISLLGQIAPRLSDLVMEKSMFKLQQASRQGGDGHAHRALHQASGEGEVRGRSEWPVRKSSLYTKASMHPGATLAAAVSTGLIIGSLVRGRREQQSVAEWSRNDD